MAERKHGEGCQGCYYYQRISTQSRACHYCYEEGMSRDCPAGAECTKRKPIQEGRLKRQNTDSLFEKAVKL